MFFLPQSLTSLQNGMDCYCSNSFSRRYGPSENCNVQCAGEREKICGGKLANSIFHVPHGEFELAKLSTIIFTHGSLEGGKIICQDWTRIGGIGPIAPLLTSNDISIRRDEIMKNCFFLDPRYRGCYQDAGERDLPITLWKKDARGSAEHCIEECALAGYRWVV